MRPVNERVAALEQRKSAVEAENEEQNTKIDEMHAFLMQAKGIKWAIIAFAGLVGFLMGVGTFLLSLGKLRLSIIGIIVLISMTAALAHDSWIMRGGHRNAAGEFCCGEGDCFMVEPVRVTANGYLIMATGELVPEREAHPSPDGKFWRCKRPDGSRRCFFAPPPSM